MEACLPELFWSGRVCYRRNPFLKTDDYQEGGYYEDEQAFDDNVCENRAEDYEDLACFNIQQLANGNFKANFHVPNAYYGVVIGKKGSTKQRLERETKTEVQIPKLGSGTSNEIIVTGSSRNGVASACNRIQMIVQSARVKQPFTHFVSIPMNSAEMKKSFLNFKREVLQACKDSRGIDDSLFQDPGLLHLTVCTVPLMDEIERQSAAAILEDFKPIIQKELVKGELTVEVKGLEIMNDDKAEVDVLYAKVKPAEAKDEHKLQLICDQIMMKFVEANLAQRQYDRVKLHLTVMNSLFRNDPSVVPGPGNFEESKRETFDCRAIFDHFSNYHFGRVKVTEIHLSQRGSSRRKEGEYYIPSWIVKINSE